LAGDVDQDLPTGRVLHRRHAPRLLDPRAAIAAFEETLPADGQPVNSSGHCSFCCAQMRSRAQAFFLTIREFRAIGDGSLLMHIQELETIRSHGLNILIIVMNDGACGSEIHRRRADIHDQIDAYAAGRPIHMINPEVWPGA
jgi:hypothetical protein